MPSDFSISDIVGENSVGNRQDMSEMGEIEEDPIDRVPYQSKHPLPKPAKYNGVGPKKFSSFREAYEDYAASMWGGETKRWKRGLEGLLDGHPLSLYLSYMNQGLSYETIMENLEGVFKGEVDPYMCRKLLELKLMKKGNDETWLIFLSRIGNLLCEIYPEISVGDKEVRMREILLQKFDNETAKQVVQTCMIRKDFTPTAVFDAVTSLDSIPLEIMGVNWINGEVLNMAINTNKWEGETVEKKHCLFCGSKLHYMGDCDQYAKLFKNFTHMAGGPTRDLGENEGFNIQGFENVYHYFRNEDYQGTKQQEYNNWNQESRAGDRGRGSWDRSSSEDRRRKYSQEQYRDSGQWNRDWNNGVQRSNGGEYGNWDKNYTWGNRDQGSWNRGYGQNRNGNERTNYNSGGDVNRGYRNWAGDSRSGNWDRGSWNKGYSEDRGRRYSPDRNRSSRHGNWERGQRGSVMQDKYVRDSGNEQSKPVRVVSGADNDTQQGNWEQGLMMVEDGWFEDPYLPEKGEWEEFVEGNNEFLNEMECSEEDYEWVLDETYVMQEPCQDDNKGECWSGISSEEACGTHDIVSEGGYIEKQEDREEMLSSGEGNTQNKQKVEVQDLINGDKEGIGSKGAVYMEDWGGLETIFYNKHKLETISEEGTELMDDLDIEGEENNGRVLSYYVDITIGDLTMKAFIDTGASMSVISEGVLARCSGVKIKETKTEIRGVGNVKLKVEGLAITDITIGKTKYKNETFAIVDSGVLPVEAILGLNFFKKNKIMLELGSGWLMGEEGQRVQLIPKYYRKVEKGASVFVAEDVCVPSLLLLGEIREDIFSSTSLINTVNLNQM